ncbi:MAG: cytochrome c maturation protein CcmE [Chloroflexi bacterium]|nr:cytochrome c maturation protein CcmE [Chloroflexota bacterium]
MALAAQSERAPSRAINLKFLIAGGVIALAVAYLVMMGLQGTTVYFLTVSELEAKGPAAQNQLYRVSGNLVPGSLVRDSGGLTIHFSIADATAPSQPLDVVYRGGQVPDIMGDNIEIVAEGKLDAQGTFAANNVLAKCPSRLENAAPDEHDYSASS